MTDETKIKAALDDIAFIRKTLGRTWINQMQRECVEEIHARLNNVEAALAPKTGEVE